MKHEIFTLTPVTGERTVQFVPSKAPKPVNESLILYEFLIIAIEA